MITHFEGTCDVCGTAISLDHDDANGIIDIWFDEDDTYGTWIRHSANATANPNCAIYSSRVTARPKGTE